MAEKPNTIESPKTIEERIRERHKEDTERTTQRVPQLREITHGKLSDEELEALARNEIARERMTERVKKWAGIDPLTGLPTRKAFQRETEKEIETVRRYESRGLIIALGDLDDFGIYNKLYGEKVGDIVLKGLGEKLRKIIRPTDTAGRWGGEEFPLTLPYSKEETKKKEEGEENSEADENKDKELKDPFHSVERVRENLTEIEVQKNGITSTDQISLTFGATQYQPHDTFETMFSRVSDALKIAKLLGKKRTVVAEHGYFRDLSTNKIYLLEADTKGAETLTDIQTNTNYRIVSSETPKARPTLEKIES